MDNSLLIIDYLTEILYFLLYRRIFIKHKATAPRCCRVKYPHLLKVLQPSLHSPRYCRVNHYKLPQVTWYSSHTTQCRRVNIPDLPQYPNFLLHAPSWCRVNILSSHGIVPSPPGDVGLICLTLALSQGTLSTPPGAVGLHSSPTLYIYIGKAYARGSYARRYSVSYYLLLVCLYISKRLSCQENRIPKAIVFWPL